MNAQQTLDANRGNPFFVAMHAMGWRLIDGGLGPCWWRELRTGEQQGRATVFGRDELVEWLLNRPEHEHEPRVLHLLVYQRKPGRAHHVPQFVARLNIHDGLRVCEGRSDKSLDEAVADLVATVAMFEAGRR